MHGKKAFCFILILANVLFLALLLGFEITFSENLGLSKTKFSQNDVNFTQNAEFLNQNTTNLSQNTENLAKNGENLSKNGENLTQNAENLAQNDINLIQNTENLAQNITNSIQNSENLSQNTEISALTAQILSFEFAFFATLLIILISFFSYKKGILKLAQSAENTEISSNQNADFINKNAVNLSIQQSENSQIQTNLQNTQILAIKNDDFLNKNAENSNNQNTKFSNQNAVNLSDQSTQTADLNSSESNQESGVKPKFGFKYMSLFFSLAKLLGYAFLAAGFLALNRHAMLDLVGFLGGISSLIFAVLIFAFYLRKG